MLALKILIVLSTFLASVIAQYQYAISGFPNSLRWRGILFITGAMAAFSLPVLFPSLLGENASLGITEMVIVTLTAILLGMGFAWLLPLKVKRVIKPCNKS